MNWSEACKSVDYDLSKSKPPAPTYKYFAYKEGKCTECSTLGEAKALSKNYEVVCDNQEEINAYWKVQSELEGKASEVFHRELRDEYSYIQEEVYNLCYSKAYEDGHSCGYDEVANYLYSYVEFAESIITASKEK